MKKRAISQVIAACTFELTKGLQSLQILPDGEFSAEDGRPFDAGTWKMSPQIAEKVIALANSRQRDSVIDYEHQTLYSENNGKPAPAAGWFHDLEYKEGKGLFITDPRWTEDAALKIDKDEYRYLSCVFSYHPKTGEVIRVRHVALTNDPGLDGMEEVETLAAAKFNSENNPDEDNQMNEAILKLLALDAEATEEDVIAALKAILGKVTGHDAAVVALNTEHGEAIAALKTELEKGVDKSKFVPLSALEEVKEQLADLKSKHNESEVTLLVDAAMTIGKILPRQEQWALDLGATDIAALKSYIEQTPAIAALNGKQTGDKIDDQGEVTLGEESIAVCKQLGVSQEDYKKTQAADQAAA